MHDSMPSPVAGATPDNCRQLVQELLCHLQKTGLSAQTTVVRVSMGEDLARVQRFGTSRAGRSDKVWDKADSVDKNLFSRLFPDGAPLHENVVIASRLEDLTADAALHRGTLAHKLTIYPNPFFTLYDRTKLMELLAQNPGADAANQGRHWLFTVPDKRTVVQGLLSIQLDASGRYYLIPRERTL